jgi:hypothetical protein
VILLNCFKPYFVNFYAKNIVQLTVLLTGSWYEYLYYHLHIVYYYIRILRVPVAARSKA